MDIIFKYFPNLSSSQKELLGQLFSLYNYWNEKINVISRKDISNLAERHILHSLALGKIISFDPGVKVADIGTGGGLPGIPLAILFPKTHFYLIDSVGKKIKVVNEICSALKLDNIETVNNRIENSPILFNYGISRAVSDISTLINWTKNNWIRSPQHSSALYVFKGDNIENEIKSIKNSTKIYYLKEFFSEEFFRKKVIVEVFV